MKKTPNTLAQYVRAAAKEWLSPDETHRYHCAFLVLEKDETGYLQAEQLLDLISREAASAMHHVKCELQRAGSYVVDLKVTSKRVTYAVPDPMTDERVSRQYLEFTCTFTCAGPASLNPRATVLRSECGWVLVDTVEWLDIGMSVYDKDGSTSQIIAIDTLHNRFKTKHPLTHEDGAGLWALGDKGAPHANV